MRGIRHYLVMLDDAVHDDLWQSTEADYEDYAENRDRRPTRQQEQRLQDRIVGQRKSQLKAAAARRRLSYLNRGKSIDQWLGHRHGFHRPSQQGEVEGTSH